MDCNESRFCYKFQVREATLTPSAILYGNRFRIVSMSAEGNGYIHDVRETIALLYN